MPSCQCTLAVQYQHVPCKEVPPSPLLPPIEPWAETFWLYYLLLLGWLNRFINFIKITNRDGRGHLTSHLLLPLFWLCDPPPQPVCSPPKADDLMWYFYLLVWSMVVFWLTFGFSLIMLKSNVFKNKCIGHMTSAFKLYFLLLHMLFPRSIISVLNWLQLSPSKYLCCQE